MAAYDDSVMIVVTGGVLGKAEHSLLGHIAELSLTEVWVDKIFMGMQANSTEGSLTTDHLPEVGMPRRILKLSPELIVMVDHTKLGKMAATYLAQIERMTTLVTDAQANAGILT